MAEPLDAGWAEQAEKPGRLALVQMGGRNSGGPDQRVRPDTLSGARCGSGGVGRFRLGQADTTALHMGQWMALQHAAPACSEGASASIAS